MNLPTCRYSAQILRTRYFDTGKACKRGHVARRFTANGNCEVCTREDALTAHYRKTLPARVAKANPATLAAIAALLRNA